MVRYQESFYSNEDFSRYATVSKNAGKTRRYVKLARLTLLIAFVSLFLVGTIYTVSVGSSNLIHWVAVKQEEGFQKKMGEYDIVKVSVETGETAWDLQSKLTPEKDVRDMLTLAQSLNPGLNLGDIQAGKMIVLLKAKNK